PRYSEPRCTVGGHGPPSSQGPLLRLRFRLVSGQTSLKRKRSTARTVRTGQSAIRTLIFPLVPKLCLGTQARETLFREYRRRAGTRNGVSRHAFPNRVWEQ